jgi:hypothetical protein
MTSDFTFNIGGFTLSVQFPDNCEGAFPSPYKHFASEREPDVSLRVQPGRFPYGGDKEKIFDCRPNWSLYRSSGKYILSTMFQEALFDPDFRSADLYTLSERDDSLSPKFLVYPLHEILMINLLCRDQGVILHACGIIDRGEGILFCGMSGGGKSTLANIWKDEEGVTVLSDDRIIVRRINGDLIAFGTPWHGEAGYCSPERVRLRKIFFIEHAGKNWVKKISRTTAVSNLLTRSFPPLWDREGMERTLEFVDTLSSEIPCYALGFVPDDRVVDFVRNV